MRRVLLKNNTDALGRVYDRRSVDAALSKHRLGYIMGELGSGTSDGIMLDRLSHQIEHIHYDGNDLIGVLKVLKTPMGNILQGLLDEEIPIRTSFRTISMIKDDVVYVESISGIDVLDTAH